MKRIFYISMIIFSAALMTSAAQAQWVQTNGPYGASVTSIISFGTNIFIGTEGGVYESTDQGSHWQRKSKGLLNAHVYALTACGNDIFAGTAWNGIYRSIDSGATWSSASQGLPNPFTVQTLGSDGHTLYIPTGSATYTSSNDGNEWVLVDTNLTKFANPDAILSLDSITYLAGGWIIYTTDNGSSWGVTSVSQNGNSWDIFSMANIGSVLFVVDRSMGIMRSTDRGNTWESATIPTSPSSILFLTSIGSELFAGTFGSGLLYRSSDSGNSWEPASDGLPNALEVSCLASNGTELLASVSEIGIYRSFDSGKIWSECDSGIINTSVTAIVSTGDTAIVGASGGVFLSVDNGASWQPKRNGMSGYRIQSLLIDGNNLYAGSSTEYYQPGVAFSKDRGENWNYPDTGLDKNMISSIIHSGNNLVAGGSSDNPLGYGLYISSDSGLTWNVSSAGWNGGPLQVSYLMEVGSVILATTNGPPFSSFDNGNSWVESNAAGSYFHEFITTCLGLAGAKVFVSRAGPEGGSTGAIFVSDDTGASWYRAIDSSVPARGIVNNFTSLGNNLFVATDSDGVFLTTDYGASWSRENLGLGDSNIVSLAVQGNELLAGTATSGVWRRPLAEMIPTSSVAIGKQIADTISIYPDPASSIVTVSCPAMVGWAEANLISETGATVWHRTITTNGQPFQLDLTGVANGAYRLNFVAGGVTRATKIALQR